MEDSLLSSVLKSLPLIIEWFGVMAEVDVPSTRPPCLKPCTLSSFHTIGGEIVTQSYSPCVPVEPAWIISTQRK